MQWFNDINLRGKLMAGFGLTLLIVVVLVTLAYRTTKANQEANAWVTHTLEVMGTADQALSGLADMETGYRGFLVLLWTPLVWSGNASSQW